MSRFTPSQARYVLAAIAHVDGLLQGMERLAADERSPFTAERNDLAPDEARLLRSFTALARQRLLAALDQLGIPRPEPARSARWSIDTALTFADIALGDLSTGRLRGYGAVDPGAARELEALADDLRSIVARGKALLHERDAGGLAERIAAITGPVGDVLRSVEQASTTHALVAVRPLLAAAAERAASTTFDVGVFGRVSAGKSSLINAIVRADLLPVGATPVTAVPVRVAHGAEAVAVDLLDGRRLAVGREGLEAYATETRNPQNRLGVRAIEARAPVVPVGLRLLDTPGVGSLSASGPAQAFAWLPRCDLGLVLVAAGSPVGREELALVTGLRGAGIACRVLLSKADLLDAPEVEEALRYVRGELSGVLGSGHDVAVHPVSARAAHAAVLDALRREVLEPLAADHELAARAALRARLHRLVDATAAALAGRDAPNDVDVDAAHRAGRAAEAVHRVTDALLGAAPGLLDRASEAVAAAWQRGEDGAPAARQVLVSGASATLAAVRSIVDALSDGEAGESAGARVPPLFDPELLDALPDLAAPGAGRRLLGRRAALGRLQPLAEPLATALARYASRLDAWGMARLEERGGRESGTVPAAPGDAGPALARLHALIEQL